VGAGQLAGQAPLTEAAARVRAFFGLPVPEPQRLELGQYLESCAAMAPNFRWSAADNLHVTVRFIGSIERELVEGLADRLEGGLGAPFELALGSVDQFRRSRLARVVWLSVTDGAGELRELASKVEAACRAAGLEAEERAFKPHLTLARARPRDGAALPDLPSLQALPPWRAEDLVLYWSHLGKRGAVHEPIRRIRLTQPD
jgi:RNA 2',3'-cyclic 3'-phosphodiesterase